MVIIDPFYEATFFFNTIGVVNNFVSYNLKVKHQKHTHL